MALNYKLLYFRIKKPDFYTSLNLKPIVKELLMEYYTQLNPNELVTVKVLKTSIQNLKKQMIHHIRILMLAFLSPITIQIEVFEFLDKFIDFFTFGFIVEEIFEYLLLYLHSFERKTKYMLFDFIYKINQKFKSQSYLYVYEKYKNQNENSLLFFIDGYYNKEALEKFLIGYTRVDLSNMSREKVNHYYNYILCYNSRKYKYECLDIIAKFLRKSIAVVLFDIENLEPFDKNIRQLCNLSITEMKHMPLNTFISLCKLLTNILEIKITLDHKDIRKQELLGMSVENTACLFINFCIHYFSQNRHLAFMHQTIYAIRDINIHKKLIDNLIYIYTKIKHILYEYKNFPDKISLYKYANNTYYDRKYWSMIKTNKHFTHKKRSLYMNYPEVLAETTDSKAVVKSILWFIKQQTDILRSLLYNEFKNINIGIFNDNITIHSKDIIIIRELFKINPGTSFYFIQR